MTICKLRFNQKLLHSKIKNETQRELIFCSPQSRLSCTQNMKEWGTQKMFNVSYCYYYFRCTRRTDGRTGGGEWAEETSYIRLLDDLIWDDLMQKRWEGSDWKPKDNKQDWGESFHFFQTIRKRSFCSRQRRVEIRLNGFCLHGKDKNKEKRGQELPIF